MACLPRVQCRTVLPCGIRVLCVQVLPSMWCRFERMWFPHKGILEDTVTKQPFLCPFDHIIDVSTVFPLHAIVTAKQTALGTLTCTAKRTPTSPLACHSHS